MSKLREFWLLKNNSNKDVLFKQYHTVWETDPKLELNGMGHLMEAVHVIEKSAYDKAIEALKVVIKSFDAGAMYSGDEVRQTLRELGELDE